MGSDEGLGLTGPLFCLLSLFSLMFDEIEWSQIIDGIDLSRYCAVGRYIWKKKGKKRKEKSDDGFLVPRDYPYISTSKMLDVCIFSK